MKKGIKEVRKSIAKRRELRNLTYKNPSIKQEMDPFPQEEEKHGYYPSFRNPGLETNKKKLPLSLIIKAALSILLFFGSSILINSNIDVLSKSKKWTSYVLTEEFPFASAHAWYRNTFGSPLTFTFKDTPEKREEDLLALPVTGNVTESFSDTGTGIRIAPENLSTVFTWNEGVVIFAGNDQKTKRTVIVQHADRSKSVYGYLSTIDVHLYQFVQSNEKIGLFNPSENSDTVYFSIEKNNEYIDPVQVIKVDDF